MTSPARRPTPAGVLTRETFTTSRLAEFCSQRELVAQTGHAVADWPLVILKELVDNAIDIAEEIGTAPSVDISVDSARGEIVVVDNGPGLPPETVVALLDYSVRVSSREAYVSPTRGAHLRAATAAWRRWRTVSGHRTRVGSPVPRGTGWFGG